MNFDLFFYYDHMPEVEQATFNRRLFFFLLIYNYTRGQSSFNLGQTFIY